MVAITLPNGRVVRQEEPRAAPREAEPEWLPVVRENSGGLARLARDMGLQTPESIATPEMTQQTGLPIGLLRWIPLFVAGLVTILVAGIGLVTLTVL